MQESELRAMSDDELLDLYTAAVDITTRAGVMTEAARRDRLAQAAEKRTREREEWYLAAHAEYLAAEAQCNGELVNRAGVSAKVPNGLALWSGPKWRAEAWATDELRDWWKAHGRLTFTEWRHRKAMDEAAERAQGPYAVPGTEVIPVTFYRPSIRVRTPDGRTETVGCPHPYWHETRETALRCAARLARVRNVPLAGIDTGDENDD